MKFIHFNNDIEKFRNKRVMVCGGGDSAVDWALMLESIAEKVTLVHRRDKFKAHEHSVEKLQTSSVVIKTPYTPIKLDGENGKIKSVILENTKGEKHEVIEVDELIVNYKLCLITWSNKELGIKK